MEQFQFEKMDSFSNENGEKTTRFCLAGLEQSQGITIGNALRRVLLTDLMGTAITAVRIYGVNHEYGTIPGVREDVLEILLNLKQIKFHGTCSDPVLITLEIEGPYLLTAVDITVPSNLNVINTKQYIATISEQTKLKLELQIESGCGYRLVTDELHRDSGTFLNIDAIFTPVKNVSYKVLDLYRFDEKLLEDLVLEITTDGSLNPKDALIQAANILQNMFGSLTVGEPKALKQTTTISSRQILIEELQLSVRAYNCLKRANIRTIDDLTQYSIKELKELKNFGQKSANEVIQKLQDRFDIRLN
uniref:DNA-directed RNA polymerase subunit alpha n=1 Tax=Aureoumbra lagunensis TaxID=44058 RepID=C6KIW1_9STRA|nr:DNA-directed RNA polymerase alpha chain [Aureoumbra lagunensis]ACS36917.1 DNA-directed RNA polymerase alpha chain [Aureoumbra lagunensis]